VRAARAAKVQQDADIFSGIKIHGTLNIISLHFSVVSPRHLLDKYAAYQSRVIICATEAQQDVQYFFSFLGESHRLFRILNCSIYRGFFPFCER
jgi:hypothetical protein